MIICDACQKKPETYGEAHGTKLCPECWARATNMSAGAKEWEENMKKIKTRQIRFQLEK